jgi:hypothetical protein
MPNPDENKVTVGCGSCVIFLFVILVVILISGKGFSFGVTAFLFLLIACPKSSLHGYLAEKVILHPDKPKRVAWRDDSASLMCLGAFLAILDSLIVGAVVGLLYLLNNSPIKPDFIDDGVLIITGLILCIILPVLFTGIALDVIVKLSEGDKTNKDKKDD